MHLFFLVCRCLPLDKASALGGWIGRTIGPRLAASRKALKNIERVFPDYTEPQKQDVLSGMWDNLGRVMAEYPHLQKIGRERTEIVNADKVTQFTDDHRPVILFSAHMANWEVPGTGMLHQLGTTVAPIYRAPNNPWVNKTLQKARTLGGRFPSFPKSRAGTKQLVQALKSGQTIGILIDQKYNEGLPVPFFGHPAMTSPAFVQMAQKYDTPLIPVQVERLDGAHFRINFHDPMTVKTDDGENRPVTDVISEAHHFLESGIRQHPAQWLWLHRRWTERAVKEYNKEKTAQNNPQQEARS